jgi:dolichyl-diphosphooligosaccharide--protein glycosyltransferase
VLNELSREIYVMDDLVYRSMLIQMLIGDPERFSDHFELVEDRFPWNRAYRAKDDGA